MCLCAWLLFKFITLSNLYVSKVLACSVCVFAFICMFSPQVCRLRLVCIQGSWCVLCADVCCMVCVCSQTLWMQHVCPIVIAGCVYTAADYKQTVFLKGS